MTGGTISNNTELSVVLNKTCAAVTAFNGVVTRNGAARHVQLAVLAADKDCAAAGSGATAELTLEEALKKALDEAENDEVTLFLNGQILQLAFLCVAITAMLVSFKVAGALTGIAVRMLLGGGRVLFWQL